jgi:acetolactate synthase small subunit
MPSILDERKLNLIVDRVKTPKDIEKIVDLFDSSSKDAPLFFQSLEIAGKKDILDEYIKTLAPTD